MQGGDRSSGMLHRPGRSYSPRALGSGRSPAGGENVVRRALLRKCEFCVGCLWPEAAPPRSGQEHNTVTGLRSVGPTGKYLGSFSRNFQKFLEISTPPTAGGPPLRDSRRIQPNAHGPAQRNFLNCLNGKSRRNVGRNCETGPPYWPPTPPTGI